MPDSPEVGRRIGLCKGASRPRGNALAETVARSVAKDSMNRLRNLWANVVGSLWFTPSIIVFGSIALAIGMVEVSGVVDDEALARWPRIFGATPEGSRSMLSGIATSMITVAGVTFSITVVAVTQASSQYTPRILRNFMRDRANQVVLGIFVGIFAYCIVVLRTIRDADGLSYVPSLAVLLGVLLAIVGIGVLIFFVHHIATSLQASEITARITRETMAGIERIHQPEADAPAAWRDPEDVLAAVAPDAWRAIGSPATGYVQHLDVEAMVRWAFEHDLLVRAERTAGDFVIAGVPAAWIAPHPRAGAAAAAARNIDGLCERLGGLYSIGTYRTTTQDVAFGIRQLVDIALKALSPGINDTTTASTCVDYLGAILVKLANRSIETVMRSDDGLVRVVRLRPTFESLLHLACVEIRQNARGNTSVLAHQLEALATVARATRSMERKSLVVLHMQHVHDVASTTVAFGPDRASVLALAARVLEEARENEPKALRTAPGGAVQAARPVAARGTSGTREQSRTS